MRKFLPVGIALLAALILAALTFRFFLAPNQEENSALPPESSQTPAVEELTQPVPTSTPISEISNQVATLSDKVNKIDSTVNDLKSRVVVLESKQNTTPAQTSTTTTNTPTSTSKAPVYIPLAASGSSSAGDWANISGTVATIDTADYPGYTSMQFEANIQIFQQGTAFARMGNKTDGTAVLSSEIYTTSTSYTYITSSKFTLPAGKKDYQLQLKSLVANYAASIQNARVKVNF
ncbi:MAG: hypothetical protein HYW45_02895 [Candidatus Daviesbacteria bacterium]|nr:MAG: hypothetical protein HYW45_02895 [Candidatus Daviesbacteria bacterium]